MPDDGHVPGAMALAEAGLVFLEDGVEDPVEAVFDAPVSAHGACGVFGGEACGGDVVAGVEAAAVPQFGARGDAHDGGGTGQAQFAGEAARAGEPVGLARDGDAALFDAAMALVVVDEAVEARSEEHTSELQSLMRISYAGFCLK